MSRCTRRIALALAFLGAFAAWSPTWARAALWFQFSDNSAVGCHALLGAETVGARDQRIGISEVQVIEIVAPLVRPFIRLTIAEEQHTIGRTPKRCSTFV